MEIRILSRRGISIRAIARDLRISRNTVRRYLCEEAVTAPERRVPVRPRQLEPYGDWIRWCIEGATPTRLLATALHREVSAIGFDVTSRTVKRFPRC
jgi:transposase